MQRDTQHTARAPRAQRSHGNRCGPSYGGGFIDIGLCPWTRLQETLQETPDRGSAHRGSGAERAAPVACRVFAIKRFRLLPVTRVRIKMIQRIPNL